MEKMIGRVLVRDGLARRWIPEEEYRLNAHRFERIETKPKAVIPKKPEEKTNA